MELRLGGTRSVSGHRFPGPRDTFALVKTCAFPFLLVIAGLLIPETGPGARDKAGAEMKGTPAEGT